MSSPPWPSRYIGTPWVPGESDCWAVSRRIWREVFGWDVPAVDVDAMRPLGTMRAFKCHPEHASWRPTAVPVEGCAVLMGQSSRAGHVGVWTMADGGGVVHSVQGAGVVFTPLQSLAAMGYRVLGYYVREV